MRVSVFATTAAVAMTFSQMAWAGDAATSSFNPFASSPVLGLLAPQAAHAAEDEAQPGKTNAVITDLDEKPPSITEQIQAGVMPAHTFGNAKALISEGHVKAGALMMGSALGNALGLKPESQSTVEAPLLSPEQKTLGEMAQGTEKAAVGGITRDGNQVREGQEQAFNPIGTLNDKALDQVDQAATAATGTETAAK